MIPVLSQLTAHPLFRRGAFPVHALHFDSLTVQVIGGEIRSEIRAVAVDRAVLHQAEGQKRLLPSPDIVAGEDSPPRFGDDAARDGRTFLVDTNRQVPQNREAHDERQDNGLEPARGDQHRRTSGIAHAIPPDSFAERVSIV
jgi:hypothetical protein